uniref:Uncharacterized protein n=1 Tax=Physcomitrium patens TaxID=3218 RepID=A0A2K1KJ14_PHYPA|nr:hypothetical protein PHYPA_007442 [Physcomitrium patens]
MLGSLHLTGTQYVVEKKLGLLRL